MFWSCQGVREVLRSFDQVEFLLWLGGMWVGRHKNAKVLSACWMCSVGPVGVSICLDLTLMWYHMCCT